MLAEDQPKMVVSRSEILGRVWDCSYDAPSKLADVYVGFLRRSDRPSWYGTIETVLGQGYRLCREPVVDQE